MGLFGKSFDVKVNEAVDGINRMNLGVRGLRAVVDGKVVTLEGEVDSFEAKGKVAEAFNKLVDTENTLNKLKIVGPAPAAAKPNLPGPGAAPAEERFHTVVAGDTLSGLAQKHYGKASLYMKIFEANKDILSDPNLIKIGQKLRIPK